MIDEQQLVDEWIKRGGITPGRHDVVFGREVPGDLTGLTCSCGGLLREVRRLADIPLPPKPTHKKRRILKKRMKEWEQTVEACTRVARWMFATQRPMYRCEVCGRKGGFYSTMARNLFPLQRMPDGAAAIYMREP